MLVGNSIFLADTITVRWVACYSWQPLITTASKNGLIVEARMAAIWFMSLMALGSYCQLPYVSRGSNISPVRGLLGLATGLAWLGLCLSPLPWPELRSLWQLILGRLCKPSPLWALARWDLIMMFYSCFKFFLFLRLIFIMLWPVNLSWAMALPEVWCRKVLTNDNNFMLEPIRKFGTWDFAQNWMSKLKTQLFRVISET